jgi:hypothetical protein
LVTALFETAPKVQHAWVKRWFFTAMALTIIAISVAGFMPAIVNPAGRHAPITLLASAHGIVFFAWLMLYLAQSLLIATRHRRCSPHDNPGRD